MMKRCNVYDVLKTIVKDGYIIVWSCTERDKRYIHLFEPYEQGYKMLGYVQTSVWQSLVNTGLLIESRSSIDKYGNTYSFYKLPEFGKLKIENAQLHAVVTQFDPEFFNRQCRVCGCDWNHPCPDGCWWVEEDLCSSCAEELKQKNRSKRSG